MPGTHHISALVHVEWPIMQPETKSLKPAKTVMLIMYVYNKMSAQYQKISKVRQKQLFQSSSSRSMRNRCFLHASTAIFKLSASLRPVASTVPSVDTVKLQCHFPSWGHTDGDVTWGDGTCEFMLWIAMSSIQVTKSTSNLNWIELQVAASIHFNSNLTQAATCCGTLLLVSAPGSADNSPSNRVLLGGQEVLQERRPCGFKGVHNATSRYLTIWWSLGPNKQDFIHISDHCRPPSETLWYYVKPMETRVSFERISRDS